MLRNTAILTIIACVLTSVNQAADLELGCIEFPDRRWSVLSEEVRFVVEGPDGRIWRQIESAAAELKEPDPVRQIETTFHSAHPYVLYWKLVLLDSSGRAWFEDGSHHIRGYDGTKWLSPPQENGDHQFYSPYDRCPTRGAFINSEGHQSAGGVTYLQDLYGIHRFDGNAWQYCAIVEPNGSAIIHLAVSPDGKSAAAAGYGHLHFQYYRNGEWRESNVIQKTMAQDVIEQLAIDNDGTVWVLQTYGRLRCFRDGEDVTNQSPPAKLQRLVEQLGADQFAERENAEAMLKPLARRFIEYFGELAKNSTDAEVRRRLSHLMENRTPVRRYSLPFAHFGRYVLYGASGLMRDPAGRLYAASDTIIDDQLQVASGVVVMNTDGSTFLLEGDEIFMALSGVTSDPVERPQGVLTHDGRAAWIRRCGLGKAPALVDFDAKRLILELPDPRHDYLAAVDRDGRVFTVNSVFDSGEQRVMVFDPSKPELRSRLRDVVKMPGAVYVVRSDPTAVLAGNEFRPSERFDFEAGTWVPLADEASTGDSWKPRRIYSENTLSESAPTASFLTLQGTPRRAYRIPLRAANDDHNYKWTSESRGGDQVVVEAVGQRLFVTEALAAAGYDYNRNALLGSIERGKRMLICAWNERRSRTGFLFVAHVDHGAVQLEPLRHQPDVDPAFVDTVALNDADGSLWLGASTRQSHCLERYVFTEYYSCRIAARGIVSQPADSGWPLLLDHDGVVWFRKGRRDGNKLELRRDGRLIQELTIADTDRVDAIFSLGPGTVFAFVSGGLLRLTADGTDDNRYKVAAFYEVPGITGTVLDVLDIGRNWVVIRTSEGRWDRGSYPFYTLRIPGPSTPQ